MNKKYRVWDLKGKCWVSCNVIVDYSGVLLWAFGYETRVIEFPDSTERYDVQYFTGFKDSTGKEVYQGDILSGDYPDGVYPDKVFWDKNRGQWMLRNSIGPDDTLWEILRDSDTAMIIGNIHEDPEPLERKD